MSIEATPELIEAIQAAQARLLRWPNPDNYSENMKVVAAILAALPEEVTNPKPKLPTETGWYLDRRERPWRLASDGSWWLGGDRLFEGTRVHEHAPFTRLVSEKPPVTVEEVREAVSAAAELGNFYHYQVIADYINNRA
jgi:hypothetical protein